MMRIHFNKDMNRGRAISLFAMIAVTCLLLLLSTTVAQAQADADGNIDGSWSYPRNDLGQTPVTCQDINNSPDDPTNENVVRYGQPIGAMDCGEPSFRSGFGFNGANTVTFSPGTPFLLGQFTHYNWNIETALVPMQFVDLTIDLQSANPPVTAQFSYTMQLDETLNFGSCPYGSTNQELCDDRVDFVNNTPPQTIVVNGVTYTLNILGFVPIREGEACTYRSDLVDYFITGELMRNDACIFAEFVIPEPAIAIEKSPDWQSIPIDDIADFTITVTNTGNIGFDVATILDPLTPDCERTITGLKSGATETYICTAYGVEQDFENVATVIAIYDGIEYSDVDTARVDVMAPDTATLHAIKYHDLNSNGQRDAGEPGLYGWTLCVRDSEGETVGFCQVTDPNGRATLAPNRAGDFLLCETPQPGWTNTDPGDGSACKPFSITTAPLYAEFFPTANDIYGVELLEKSADELRWTYAAYQFLGSQNLQAWTLALPPCIDAAQIDANATTPGWSIVEDTVNGLRGIQWRTPGGVDPTWGSPFTLAFVQPYATGASAAGIVTGADASVGGVRPVSGPICSEPVLIGNASAAPATGQLEVRKVVMPANDSGFFNLAIDSVVLATNVQNGGATGKQTVAAGVHVVGEGGGASTDLDDYVRTLSCTEMNSSRTWTPAVTGEVIVGIGEDVVCTFTNIRRGAIRIVKQVDGPATADWRFESAALGAFTLPAAGGEAEFTRLSPGSYVVTEPATPNWGLAALTCSDPDLGTVVDLANATATIDLDPGETVVCTFANVANAGRITIIKQVNGAADSPWEFTSGLGAFTLPAEGGQRVFENVAPGAYNVIETVKPSWHVAAITCNDPDGGTLVDPIAGVAMIDLDPSEEITCIFVNEPGRPAIALDKQVSAAVIYPNDTVTYTFVVENVGQIPLQHVRVDDGQCTVVATTDGDFNVGDLDQDDWLDVGEQWRFTCTNTLTRDTTNTATAYGEAPWGEVVWASDRAEVDVIAPRITLEKIADHALIDPGETVTFQLIVRNTGDTPLANIVVEDGLPDCTLAGPDGDDGDGVLAPDEAWMYTCAMIIGEDTVNVATATGYDMLGSPWNAEARARVEVRSPDIEIVKVADREYIYPNETVNFTITVRNIGNTPLMDVKVTDSLPQCALNGPVGDNGDGLLSVGEEWTYACAITVCPGQTEATASSIAPGASMLGDEGMAWNMQTLLDEATPACTQPPSLVGPSFGSCWSPSNQWFELTVVNRASTPAYIGYDIYRVRDSFRKLGRFDAGQREVFTVTQEGILRKYISADGRNNWLQLGGTHTLNIARHIEKGYLCEEAPTHPPLCGDITNVAEVTARDGAGRQVSDSASVFVDLIHPGIEVTKSADKSEIAPGEAVNFTVNVKNTGDVALTDIVVEDSLPECQLAGPSGDDGNGILDSLESWSYTCTMTPNGSITNVARASGRDPLGKSWTDEDSAAVTVIRPALELIKEANKTTIYPGETVHFTLRVRNWGNAPLSRVRVTDSMPECKLSQPIGDNGNGRLDPGEEWVYTCKVTFCKGEKVRPSGAGNDVGVACVLPGVCSDVTNVGKVTAKDPRGKTLRAEDSVFIDLIRPGLSVVKKASQTVVPPNTIVDFTIKVRNTGDTPLANVTVVDNYPECVLSQPTGDNGNGVLDPRETWRYTCSMPITQRTRNVAAASATDILGNRWTVDDSVLVRTTSGACVTVAGVQDIEACLAAESGVDAFQLFLPVTQR